MGESVRPRGGGIFGEFIMVFADECFGAVAFRLPRIMFRAIVSPTDQVFRIAALSTVVKNGVSLIIAIIEF